MRAIVVVARGCPAGWLGLYGNEWVATPGLDRLAAEGVVFDRHLSDCPDPAAAGRAWLTGRHQLPAMAGDPAGHPPAPILLAHLKAAGVRTALVRANRPANDAPATFYAGWDEVFDARPRAGDDSPLAALVRSLPALLDRLAEVPRWLVWVETDRLLPPWDVTQELFAAYRADPDAIEEAEAVEPEDEEDDDDDEEVADEECVMTAAEPVVPIEVVPPITDPPTGPFDPADHDARERLHQSFAAVVSQFDAELDGIFDQLRARGLDQTAAWLLTSDCGYPLGDRGQVGRYRPWLHDEFVHLPFVVRFPGAAQAGRRVEALTQPADLAPTLLDLFGGDTPTAVHGHSLLPLARGEAEAVRAYACSGLGLGGASEWRVQTDDRAYLVPGPPPAGDPPRPPRYYEKPADRWEVNALRPGATDWAEPWEAVLRAFAAAAQRPGPLVAPPPPGG